MTGREREAAVRAVVVVNLIVLALRLRQLRNSRPVPGPADPADKR